MTASAQETPHEELVEVKLSDIVRTDALQVRKVNAAKVRQYAKSLREGRELPPIEVVHLNGTLLLVDGWHRMAAMESLGMERVTVKLVPCEDMKAAGLYAVKANLVHGLQLKPRDIRKALAMYLTAGEHVEQRGRGGTIRKYKSYRAINAELGGLVSHHSIRNWMREDHRPIYNAMGRDEDGARSEGGLPEREFLSEEEVLTREARKALGQAAAAARGVSDPGLRGELVAEAERVLEEFRKGGRWEKPQEADY